MEKIYNLKNNVNVLVDSILINGYQFLSLRWWGLC